LQIIKDKGNFEALICGECLTKVTEANALKLQILEADETYFDVQKSELSGEFDESINTTFISTFPESMNTTTTSTYQESMNTTTMSMNTDLGESINTTFISLYPESLNTTTTSTYQESMNTTHISWDEDSLNTTTISMFPSEEPKRLSRKRKIRNKKNFQCQQCPKSFDKRMNLYSHEQSHKPKVNCQICNKKFSKQSIKVHLKKHATDKKFNCDYCSVGFVLKGQLVQHMWKHRSDKQFNCTHCNRGFNNNYDFKVHLRSHSNNPWPFQCDLCPLSFPRKKVFQQHLMAMHSEQSFNCDECNYTTKWKPNLTRHKKTHSNTSAGGKKLNQSTLATFFKKS
jgi:uncharacterized Zn-finger protein